ncbi:tryptophan halogenase family protein [Maricaulis sp. MIT060901]|uniref:tryptophan halogenase family protein n=1 Tax=Maricaulis sp. MIT060901 TaxID=3096993 RepID=UPI00399A43A8
MENSRIKRLLVVGGGTAGWMAAAALSKFLGEGLEISLVESDQIGIVGVGEATIPQIKHLNRALELDERKFVARTQGSFKLGIEFQNWRQKGHAYLHNFGSIGLNVNSTHFHHYWLRSRAEGNELDLWDYCVNTEAARQGRFAPLEKLGSSPLNGIAYAYHFDAALYGQFLRNYAEQRGVTRIEGRIVDVHQDSESGEVRSVELESGQKVEADFFIDCSGFRGLLIEGALETGYEDWTHWLKCDRAFAVPSENAGPIRPYTQSIAHDAGWQWRIPLQHRTGNGHVFSSAYTDEDAARETLLANLEGEPLSDPRLIRFTTGRRKKFWNRNVVALGLASGFLEPLESTSIHLIQSGISRLVPLFPAGAGGEALADEYNRQMGLEYEKIRDFIILHYHLNERTDSPFWIDCREMDVPDTLVRKMALFRESGRLYHEQEDLFTDSSWLQVMLGQGITPQAYHPVADDMSSERLEGFLGDIRRIVTSAAGQLPSHEDFVRSNCPAPAG